MLNFGPNLCCGQGLVFFFFFFFLWAREVALRPTHEQASVDWCPITRHDLFSRTLPAITCRNLV